MSVFGQDSLANPGAIDKALIGKLAQVGGSWQAYTVLTSGPTIWSVAGGAITLFAGDVRAQANSLRSLAFLPAVGGALPDSASVVFNPNFDDGADAAVGAHATASGSLYLANSFYQFGSNNQRLQRYDNGVPSATLFATSTVTFPLSTNTQLKIEVLAGGVVNLRLAGALCCTLTDPSPLAAGGTVLGGKSVTLRDFVADDASGAAGGGPLTGNAVLADASASGGMTGVGVVASVTVPELRNWADQLLALTTIENVLVIRVSDRTVVASFTNQSTNAQGDLLLLSAAFGAPGTPVMVLGFSADGSNRLARAVNVV